MNTTFAAVNHAAAPCVPLWSKSDGPTNCSSLVNLLAVLDLVHEHASTDGGLKETIGPQLSWIQMVNLGVK